MTKQETYRCFTCGTLFDSVTRFTVHGGNRVGECTGHDDHCIDERHRP